MSRDSFDNFDKHFEKFDKRVNKALEHPRRTAALWTAFALVVNFVVFVVAVAIIVGAIIFLKSQGVF